MTGRNVMAAYATAVGATLGGASLVIAAPTLASPAQQAVQAALNTSAAGWNAGNLDEFMAIYDRAPATTYVNSSHFARGYDAIRAMYAERFAGGAPMAMGQLSIEILDFRLLGPSRAYVVGRFHLHRAPAQGGDASGFTTLVFANTAKGWRIVADHS